jgi:hypothetical protein
MSAVFILLIAYPDFGFVDCSVQRLVPPSSENAVCGNMFVSWLSGPPVVLYSSGALIFRFHGRIDEQALE